MAHPFPQESVERARVSAEVYLQLYRKPPRPLGISRGVMDRYSNWNYGFLHNLRTGNYAHWPHDAYTPNAITQHNCTTVIPAVYLDLEAFGVKAEIVQFVNFQTFRGREKKDQQTQQSHFALIVDLGKKQKYLLDPFWHIFGPISHQDKQSMRVRSSGKYEAVRRKYARLVKYTPQEFAAMMKHLSEPAGSLDMLVAGQKVSPGEHMGTAKDCQIMVYYRDDNNTLTTRLYIPQIGIADKGIYCTQALNDEGEVDATSLRLVTAKESSWNSLIGEKTIARTDFTTLNRLRKLRRKIAQKDGRVGPQLLNPRNKSTSEEIMEIATDLESRLTDVERKQMEIPILTRTLYEATQPERRYISSQEERDEHLIDLIEKDQALVDKIRPFSRREYYHGWKLKMIPKERHHKTKKKITELEKEKEKIVPEIDSLNRLRCYHRTHYDRLQDKIVFSKSLEEKSVEELRKIVEEQELDPILGYVAIVMDYLPFTTKGREILELKRFVDKLIPKVKARRALREES